MSQILNSVITFIKFPYFFIRKFRKLAHLIQAQVQVSDIGGPYVIGAVVKRAIYQISQ